MASIVLYLDKMVHSMLPVHCISKKSLFWVRAGPPSVIGTLYGQRGPRHPLVYHAYSEVWKYSFRLRLQRPISKEIVSLACVKAGVEGGLARLVSGEPTHHDDSDSCFLPQHDRNDR